MKPRESTDVLICGGGPVGRLIALGLAQHGIDAICIEKRSTDEQKNYGRACTIQCRSLELLETLDLTSDLTQAGFIGHGSAGYKDGKRKTVGGWHQLFDATTHSYHDYLLNIRQNATQDIISAKYEEDFGQQTYFNWKLVDYQVDESCGDAKPVTAVLDHEEHGRIDVRCKYLIGADGANSTVRKLSKVEMQGDDTAHKWIRIDARVKTDMPEPDLGVGSIETEDYGNVLWVTLDKDAHRIGFALTPPILAKYPDGITEEDAKTEAINALKPFKLEFERVDWWTVYGISQKVAENFHPHDHVILVGDACHTHSSGLAQGMNTGIHDATNLIWKLAGTIKGWYRPEVLKTYAVERRAVAQKLISIDKLAADVISGKIPPTFLAAGGTPADAFNTVMASNIGFTSGLGIKYGPNLINVEPTAGSIQPGSRSPDALIYAPGPRQPIRLHNITHVCNKGRWSMIIFTGNHAINAAKIARLRESILAGSSNFQKWKRMLKLSTLIHGTVKSAWKAFDGPAIGNYYLDGTEIAYERYGISETNGAIVVVRPDGVLAHAAGLHELDKIESFFKAIFV